MTTNLLLEGEDLEALLARAHAEAGAQARIVRAEKVRRGGFLGFFARPAFEVALEVPDVAPGDFAGTQAGDPTPPVVAGADAADGLRTLADQVDAAERAAARVVVDSERAAVAGAESVAARRAAELESERVAELARRAAADARRDAEEEADRAAAIAAVVALKNEQEQGVPNLEPRDLDPHEPEPQHAGPGERPAVPYEPTIQTIQPARRRPEFVALLDHLRFAGRARQRRPDPDVEPVLPEPVEESVEEPADERVDDVVCERVDELVDDLVEDPRFQPLTPPDPIDEPIPVDVIEIAPPPPVATPAPAATPAPVAAIPRQRAASAPVEDLPARHVADPAEAMLAEQHLVQQRRAELQLASDRNTLRQLGVPRAWTRGMQAGDRFAAVLRILDRLPEAAIDPDAAVVAVVGPSGVVELEAYRTAVDLHVAGIPRPVVTLPTRNGEQRRQAVAAAQRSRPVVVAIPTEGHDDATGVRRALRSAKADVVIAVVEAHRSIEDTTRWIEAIAGVDAVALDGALEVSDPASVLQLELPVIRLDGIAIDRIGWAAVLCAQLGVAGAQPDGERAAQPDGERAAQPDAQPVAVEA